MFLDSGILLHEMSSNPAFRRSPGIDWKIARFIIYGYGWR